MVRRSKVARRAALSVTLLEDRAVPAGMIDVVHNGRIGVIEIQGDNEANHVRVEKVGIPQARISSDSGPIRVTDALTGEVVITTEPFVLFGFDLTVQTGNGDDDIEITSAGPPHPFGFIQWEHVGIDSGHGNDRVLVENLIIQWLDVWTGTGDDSVSLRECIHDWSENPAGATIDTGSGNDCVSIGGLTALLLHIGLGQGDDVLEGDPTTRMPGGFHRVYVDGGSGFDRLSNPDYFSFGTPPFDFEEIG